jgi:hypothetical protein
MQRLANIYRFFKGFPYSVLAPRTLGYSIPEGRQALLSRFLLYTPWDFHRVCLSFKSSELPPSWFPVGRGYRAAAPRL